VTRVICATDACNRWARNGPYCDACSAFLAEHGEGANRECRKCGAALREPADVCGFCAAEDEAA
jgi:predicted amidophosphoribosyltransferase